MLVGAAGRLGVGGEPGRVSRAAARTGRTGPGGRWDGRRRAVGQAGPARSGCLRA
ncbi:hypothetical protein GZL_01533 [Streptomyces sp. 769]|nr:hypothetical protein GZL_01533 [Streptomyces sp. 769]